MSESGAGRLELIDNGPAKRAGEASSGPRLWLAIGAVTLGLLIPAFVLLAPPSAWDPILFGTLLVVALVAWRGQIAVNRSYVLDAGVVVDLFALVLLGPLPALAIAAAMELIAFALERDYKIGVLVANIASHGWALLAAALLLQVAVGWPVGLGGSPDVYIAIAVAGVVMSCVDWLVGAFIVRILRDRRGLLDTFRNQFVADLPLNAGLLAVAVLALWLFGTMGILALGVFAGIVLIPQLLLPVLLRPRPVDELSHPEAVALYAQAIAGVMKLDATTKAILADAAHHIEGPETQTNGGKIKAEYSGDNFHDVVEAVLYYREHWDSPDGFPGGVGGEMIPLTSRILAVSDQWASLTASGVWTVTHAQAINKLEENSGVQYDPRVVSAASRVVEEERMGLTDNAPQLHEVPLPQLVRKVPRLSGLLAGARSGA